MPQDVQDCQQRLSSAFLCSLIQTLTPPLTMHCWQTWTCMAKGCYASKFCGRKFPQEMHVVSHELNVEHSCTCSTLVVIHVTMQLFVRVVIISVNYCVHASLRCSLSEGLVSWGPVCLLRGLQGRDGDDLGSLCTLWGSGYNSSRCIQVPTIPSVFCIQTYWLNLGVRAHKNRWLE